MTLYSVGYNALPVDELDDLAHKLDALIIDVRGSPKSRKSGYGRLQLEKRFGDRLQWRGDVLGNKGGHGTTQAGLDALSEFRPDAGPHALLMCACGPPRTLP